MPELTYQASIEDVSFSGETLAATVTNRDANGLAFSQTRITIALGTGNAVHERIGDIGAVPQSLIDAAAALRAALDSYLIGLIADGKHAP
jgi:hypothetical protein